MKQPELGLLVSHLQCLASLPVWDTASATPALKSSGVSGLFSPENSEDSSLLEAVVMFGVRACDGGVFQQGKLASVPS